VRGDVRANRVRRANCCCDCDGYRPDTLGGGIGQARFLLGVMKAPSARPDPLMSQASRCNDDILKAGCSKRAYLFIFGGRHLLTHLLTFEPPNPSHRNYGA